MMAPAQLVILCGRRNSAREVVRRILFELGGRPVEQIFSGAAFPAGVEVLEAAAFNCGAASIRRFVMSMPVCRHLDDVVNPAMKEAGLVMLKHGLPLIFHFAIVAIVGNDAADASLIRHLSQKFAEPGRSTSTPLLCVADAPKRGLGFKPAPSKLQLSGERLYHVLPADRHSELERWETTFESGELLFKLDRLALSCAFFDPSPPSADFAQCRLDVALQHICEALQVASGMRCEVFGSYLTGTAGPSSDVDLTLLDDDEGYHNHENCVAVLTEAARTLEAAGYAVERRWQPRIPLLRMRAWDGTSVDVTAHNHLGRQNSLLLSEYSKISPRFVQLMNALKSWMRKHGFLGAFDGGLSSYAASVMGLHYMMVRGTDPIPNLQLNVGEADRWLCDTWGRPWRANFRNCTFKECNTEAAHVSLAEELERFMAFYVAFDWKKEVVQPALLRRGVPLDRAAAWAYAVASTTAPLDVQQEKAFEMDEHCIMCPMEPVHNTARFATKLEAMLAAMRRELPC